MPEFQDYIENDGTINQQSINALKERLSSGECLRFSNIDSISAEQAQILFGCLPEDSRNWDLLRFAAVFDNFESFQNAAIQDDFLGFINTWKSGGDIAPPDIAPPDIAPPKETKDTPPNVISKILPFKKPAYVIASFVVLASASFIGLKTFNFFNGYRVEKDQIVLGAVNPGENYSELEKYLERSLVPDSLWEYFTGKKIEVTLDASTESDAMPYPYAISALKNHSWDIGFAYSPIVGMSAVDSGYQYVAVMFPDSDSYQSSIFVRADHPIQSLDDLNREHTLALGDFFSASKFYMPAYELYGKQLNVISNVSSREIFEMVRNGTVDVGVGVIDNPEDEPDLRILKRSRNIPGTGVYISPQLSDQDREAISNLLLNVPESIRSRDNANYGPGEEPSFEYFSEIVGRVREITSCSNFSQNPVNFFCDEATEVLMVEGKINGIERDREDFILSIFQSSTEVCKLRISRDVLAQVLSDDPFSIQGLNVKFFLGVPADTQCSNDQTFPVFQPNQVEL
jgi:ABC-type phosphate/phosphonate transport system substrate-binding protein